MTPEQLKASILQRAMEGKLVPQDPNDEPASELLKRIKAEKEKLIKEGKIKRDKNETEIYRGDDGLHYEKFADGTVKKIEVPFEIPKSWEWCRIDQLAIAKGGKRVPKGMKLQEEANEYPYLRVTDMKNETILDEKIQYAPLQVQEAIKNYTISSNDLYLTIAGTIGNAGVIPEKFDGALLTENALKLVLYPLASKFFLLKAINSPAIQSQFQELFNQVAQPKLSIRSTNSTLIPLPPEKEQKRILDRLLEVLNLLPEYTKTYNKLEKLNKEFPEKLRKSILQYAMQGKLVPQDPNDEPVEVLLEKIRAEKQKLFEEGKLKKKDLEESIIYKAEDNSYYWNTEKLDLNTVFPESWKLIYFKDFLTLVSGRDLKTSEFQEDLAGTVPYLTGATNFEAGKIITFRSTNYPSVLAYKNDLLITVKGTVGEMAYNPYDKAHIARQIMSISSFVDIDLEFIRYFLSSKIEVIKSKAQSMIPGISREVLLSLVIPLPPKNEQVRITQKLAILENKVNVLKLG